MKIAYFTPLNPMHSGVSDWAEELLPYLKEYADIDLYVDQFVPESEKIRGQFAAYDIDEYGANKEKYDLAVFQMGNSLYHSRIMDAYMLYGGVLEIHDVSMHTYLAARTIANGDRDTYLKTMTLCHGKKGTKLAQDFFAGKCSAPWEEDNLIFTVNRHYIDRADAVIVHSDFARQMVKGVNKGKKVILIPLHSPEIVEDWRKHKQRCRERLKIDKDIWMLGAFGLATPFKRIVPTLYALQKLKMITKHPFVYYIVSENKISNLEAFAETLGIKENIVVTGRVNLEDFNNYMGACDVALNLRYPTQGESSASLQRLLGYGKVVLVTKVGAFQEYPDQFVKKIRIGAYEQADILKGICEVISDRNELNAASDAALVYARNCFDINQNAEKYYKGFCSILYETVVDDYNDYEEWLADQVDLFNVPVKTLFG